MRNAGFAGDIGERNRRRRGRRSHDDVGLRFRDEAPRIGRGVGRIAAVIENDDFERNACDFLRHELKRIALRYAQRGRRPRGRNRDTDGDFV